MLNILTKLVTRAGIMSGGSLNHGPVKAFQMIVNI